MSGLVFLAPGLLRGSVEVNVGTILGGSIGDVVDFLSSLSTRMVWKWLGGYFKGLGFRACLALPK